MIQHFVIITNSQAPTRAGVTAPERDQITQLLEERLWKVWHWFEDAWLVVADEPEAIDPRKIQRDIEARIDGQRHIIIIAIPVGAAATAWIPNDSMPWLNENWKEHKQSSRST